MRNLRTYFGDSTEARFTYSPSDWVGLRSFRRDEKSKYIPWSPTRERVVVFLICPHVQRRSGKFQLQLYDYNYIIGLRSFRRDEKSKYIPWSPTRERVVVFLICPHVQRRSGKFQLQLYDYNYIMSYPLDFGNEYLLWRPRIDNICVFSTRLRRSTTN